ncbi:MULTISPECIES: hypothetical protein [Streptomyces]|uniref:Integral membrane protein n=1 Tax=Streptomyces doudnae TaxID=3075536 RepID=A0ABD5EG50_9ACTN|nr:MULTISPECIES: hypothetical protein [unclassified Streptomyces]MDT0433652.1 hypothetical protein [Streptomyces sp. DSM 41981]MYQ68378.1 hypothetical protein [Streptomyces sp. SID4950]SCE45645.1 hypothetical protein GA0115242_138923 [Streptomyces sp. SolWspMP-5a-2]
MSVTRPNEPHTPDRAYARARDRRAWYLRLAEEQPIVATGCPESDCDPGPVHAHDVYCRSHDRLLPFSTSAPSRTRWFVINLLRAAVCGTFTLCAQTSSPLPVTLLAVVTGAVVLGLPLRHYPVGRAAAVGLWALTWVVYALAALTGTHGHRIIGTVVLAAVTLAWLGWTGAKVMERADDGRSRRARRPQVPDRSAGRAAGVIASGLAAVPAALVLSLLLARGPSDWLLRLPAVRGWLLVAAAGGLAGALLTALLAGAVDGWGLVALRTRQLRVPGRPAVLRWKAVDRRWHGSPPRTFGGRVQALVLELRHQSVTAALRCAAFAVNILRLTGHHAAQAAVRLANLVFRQTVVLLRRARTALLCAGQLLGRAARMLATTAPHGGRVILLPTAALALATCLVPPLAWQITVYLTRGGPVRLGLALLCALACMLLWTAGWAAFTGEPFARTRDSALHSASNTLPRLVLLTTVGGWVLGLPGTFGHGRIHVGWLTLTLTALILVFLVRTRPDRKPASDA